MKRVLIAGANSYIGTQLAVWLSHTPDQFTVQTVSVRGDVCKTIDFSAFDTVVLVAGIAHQKETPQNEALYDTVNHKLAVLVAQTAKAAGVKQLIFFSSMSVYGLTTGHITQTTQPTPDTAYGRSKLAAEKALALLLSDSFRIAVLRPPMIYGPGCRGNYPRLSALVQKLPLFPRVVNQRSMLYIDTLCDFLQTLITQQAGGLYFPQNHDYVATCELAKQIALAHGKHIRQIRGFGWLLTLLSRRGGTIGKVFGSLTYDQAMSNAYRPAQEPAFAETIRVTEAG